MSRHRRGVAGVVPAALLALALGCAGAPGAGPATPPAPPSPPPAQPRDVESPVSPERAAELRGGAVEALREVVAILDALGDETRRERRDAVATVDGLVERSRAALADDDVERAHNLAHKALTLAREL